MNKMYESQQTKFKTRFINNDRNSELMFCFFSFVLCFKTLPFAPVKSHFIAIRYKNQKNGNILSE